MHKRRMTIMLSIRSEYGLPAFIAVLSLTLCATVSDVAGIAMDEDVWQSQSHLLIGQLLGTKPADLHISSYVSRKINPSPSP